MGAPRIELMDKNLLINGNFDYWQRGTTVTGASKYGADRMVGDSVMQSQIRRDRTFSPGLPAGATYGSEYSTILSASEYGQRVESGMLAGYVGKYVTFSVKAGLVSGAPADMVFKVRTPDVKDTYGSTFTLTSPTSPPPIIHTSPYTVYAYTFLVTQAMADRGVQVSIAANAAAFEIIYSQMMLVLSPDGNDYIPEVFPYASRNVFDELNLCQRYFETVTLFIGVGQAPVTMRYFGDFKTLKRVTPTFFATTLSVGVQMFNDLGFNNNAGLTLFDVSTGAGAFHIFQTGFGAATVTGQTYFHNILNDGSQLHFDAEI